MINSSNLEKNIRNAARNVREASDRFTGGSRAEAEDLMDTSSQRVGELYDQASAWLQENNRPVLIGAAILAVGALGFFIGRSTKNSGEFSQNF
jgi:hypothetical protein